MAPSQLFTVVPDVQSIVLQLQVPNMDFDACREMESLLTCEIERRKAPVVIDLSRARFLPSLALGSLLNVKRKLDETGTAMVIVGLSENIRRALDITHLDRVFTIADNVQSVTHAAAN